MSILTLLFANTLRITILVIIIIVIGAMGIRPHWFRLVTPDTVTQKEWEANPKSVMIPVYEPISPISSAPASQSQYSEEDSKVFSTDFIINMGDSHVTFEGNTLNNQECNYLASKGNEPIPYSEFIASSNLFLTGEYFIDRWSVTPLNWYIDTLIQFCPRWNYTRLQMLYQSYETEVVIPSIIFWNSEQAPTDEPVADVRNTHEPRPSIEWIVPPTH